MRKPRRRKPPAAATSSTCSSVLVKNPKSEAAYRALVRLLARRDYSEKEIRDKLDARYTEEALAGALRRARDYGWLKDPQELAERWREHFYRKGKGPAALARALREKGLPMPTRDPQREFAKARALLDKKFSGKAKLSPAERQKAYRYLAYRGFASDTITALLRGERVDHEEF